MATARPLPRLKEDDYPNIGQSRQGYTLVCRGDDWPTEWITWLDPLASRFEEIRNLADEHRVHLTLADGKAAPASIIEFCESIGIDMDGSAWQGQMISGTWWLGWLRNGTLRAARSRGRLLVESLEAQIDTGVRKAVLRELESIPDLDVLLARTADDRFHLQGRIAQLQHEVQALRSEAQRTEQSAKEAQDRDTHIIDQACLEIACAILGNRTARIVAGPMVLWDDGVVYAMVSRGGVSIPAGSSPRTLLDALVARGYPVVQVRERTVIGGWTRGPILRKGAASINGWATVWMDVERKPRIFEVEPPGHAWSVDEIHRQLSTSSPPYPVDPPSDSQSV